MTGSGVVVAVGPGQVAGRLARPDLGRWLARSIRSGTAPTRSGSPAAAHTIDPTTGEVLGLLRLRG